MGNVIGNREGIILQVQLMHGSRPRVKDLVACFIMVNHSSRVGNREKVMLFLIFGPFLLFFGSSRVVFFIPMISSVQGIPLPVNGVLYLGCTIIGLLVGGTLMDKEFLQARFRQVVAVLIASYAILYLLLVAVKLPASLAYLFLVLNYLLAPFSTLVAFVVSGYIFKEREILARETGFGAGLGFLGGSILCIVLGLAQVAPSWIIILSSISMTVGLLFLVFLKGNIFPKDTNPVGWNVVLSNGNIIAHFIVILLFFMGGANILEFLYDYSFIHLGIPKLISIGYSTAFPGSLFLIIFFMIRRRKRFFRSFFSPRLVAISGFTISFLLLLTFLGGGFLPPLSIIFIFLPGVSFFGALSFVYWVDIWNMISTNASRVKANAFGLFTFYIGFGIGIMTSYLFFDVPIVLFTITIVIFNLALFFTSAFPNQFHLFPTIVIASDQGDSPYTYNMQMVDRYFEEEPNRKRFDTLAKHFSRARGRGKSPRGEFSAAIITLLENQGIFGEKLADEDCLRPAVADLLRDVLQLETDPDRIRKNVNTHLEKLEREGVLLKDGGKLRLNPEWKSIVKFTG